jgi:hypothetical protein
MIVAGATVDIYPRLVIHVSRLLGKLAGFGWK